MSDAELQEFIEQQANKNASKKIQSDTGSCVIASRNGNRAALNILGHFFKDIVKKDGHAGIQARPLDLIPMQHY